MSFRYVKFHCMNDIDNKIQVILPVEARFVVQSASRGARRSDAQEVHVQVPCDLHVETPVQDVDAFLASRYTLPQTQRGESLLHDQSSRSPRPNVEARTLSSECS